MRESQVWPLRKLRGLLFQSLHFTDSSERFINLPKIQQLLNGRAGPSCWPVITWWLVIWCVRVICVDGTGTRSQVCSIQSGSPEGLGERISGTFRYRVAPIHDQALSHSPLVFGHLQDIDGRTLYSESKDPAPSPGSIFLPVHYCRFPEV